MRTVLYVSPPARLGGGEISLLTLVAHLPRGRFRPLVVTYEAGELVGRMRELRAEVEVLPRGPGLIPRLAHLLLRRRVSLVHINTFDLRAAIAARWAGVPLLGHLRVIFPFTWADRLFVRLCDRTLTVSDAARDHFCREAPDLRARFTTVHNPVALPENRSRPSDLRAELGLPPETPLVGAVARIDPWKGLDVFVRAAGRIRAHRPDARFVIAGRPGESPEEVAHERDLRRLSRDLGLESDLFFLGFRDGAEVIRQLDLLLVPSLVLRTPGGLKSEGFGRVVAEALAVGTPVVASRAGGIPEILGDGEAGVLVPPGDAGALAAEALALLRDGARRSALVQRGKARFNERFTVERHVQQVIKVYEAVMNSR